MCEFAIIYALPDMRQDGKLPEIPAWSGGSRRQCPNGEKDAATGEPVTASSDINGNGRQPAIVGVLQP